MILGMGTSRTSGVINIRIIKLQTLILLNRVQILLLCNTTQTEILQDKETMLRT